MLALRGLLLALFLLAPAWAQPKPLLRLDIRNGMKVPTNFEVTGKTRPGCRVLVNVTSWDGFGAEFEAPVNGRGYFSLPVSVHGQTATTHVDILVRSYDLRRQTMQEASRFVILQRRRKP